MGRRVRLVVLISCAVLCFACADDTDERPCEPGGVVGCPIEHNGPREYRYCQADGTYSDCTPESVCNPLAQTGCSDGLVCYLASLATRVCAPAQTLPCVPGETWGHGIEGSGCQSLCVSVSGTENEDPEHCEDGEVCENASGSDAVGECYTPPEGGE